MNELIQSKQVMLIQLFELGYSHRAVSRIVGCNRNTAIRYRRLFVPKAKCPCGKDSKHNGWCKFRFSHSPRRQEYMRSIGRLKRNIDPIPPRLFFPYIFIPKCEDCGDSRGLGARYCGQCYWSRASHSINPYWQISLDAPLGDDGSLSLHSSIAAHILSPDEALMRKEEQELERKYHLFRTSRFEIPITRRDMLGIRN